MGTALLMLHLVLSPLVFSVISLESFELPKALLLRAVALLLLPLIALSLGRGGGRALLRDPVAWAAAALLGSAAFSTLYGLSPRTSFWGARESAAGLLTLASYAVLFFATRTLLQSMAAVRLLLWSIVSAVAGVSSYAVLQLAGLDPMPWRDVTLEGGFQRVASTLGNPNFLGGYLAVAFPPCVALALHARRVGRRGAAGLLGLLALMAAAICLATLSRGEWLALVLALVGLVAGLWFVGERAGVRLLAGAVLALAVLAAAYTFTDHGSRWLRAGAARIARVTEPGAEPRLELWRLGWRSFAAEPLLGIGVDVFQLAYPRHRSPACWMFPLDQAPAHAHNELLQLAASQGAVGLGAALGLLIALAAAGRRALRRVERPSGAVLIVAIAAALAAFAARSLFGFTVIGLGTLVTSYAAILWWAGSAEESRFARTEAPLSPRASGLLLAAAGVLAALVWLANGFAMRGLSRAEMLLVALSMLTAQLGVAWLAWRVERSERWPQGAARGRGQVDRARPRLRPLWLLSWVALCGLLYPLVYLPFLADAHGGLGHRMVIKGRAEASIALLEEAVVLAPGTEYLWIELGVAHHRAAAALVPGTPAARRHLERALEAHDRAAELVPVNPLNHANRGRALADLLRGSSQRRRALDAFAEALALDPRNPVILDDASRAALVLGDIDTAEVYALRSAALYPRHARARSLLGAVAMARAHWGPAERELQIASEADWRGDFVAEAAAWANLASVRLELGLPDEALAAADQALLRRPDYANGWRVKALAHAALAEGLARLLAAEARHEQRRRLERGIEEQRLHEREASRRASLLQAGDPASLGLRGFPPRRLRTMR